MRELTRCLKAVANQRRLEIIYELSRTEPLTVNVIAKRIKLSIKSTSKHLQKLADCDLVTRSQISLQVWYRLNRKQEILQMLLKSLKP